VVSDVRNISKGIDSVNTKLGGFGKSIGKAGSAIKGMFVAGAASAVGGGIVDYLKSATTSASDLSESTSKVGVVFGKSSDQIMKASQTSAKAMGLSQNAYLSATGGLGNLLVSLKIAPKAAAGMSQNMVKLAGDMASFNNASPEDVLAALQSGLTGETEPLKKFGINMNDATLKAEALKQGLIKNTKEALTPQNKALAAQGLIMSQSKTAQGDFARTSGGLANQQRILAATLADSKTAFGSLLLPIVTKVITFINTTALPGLKKFSDWFKSAIGPPIQSLVELLKAALMPVFETVQGGIKALGEAFKAGGDDVTSSGFAGVMEKIGLFARKVSDFFTGEFVGGVRALGAAFMAGGTDITSSGFAGIMEQIGLTVRNIGDTVIRNVIPAVQKIVPVLINLGSSIVSNVIPVIGSLVTFFMTTLIPAFLSVYSYVMANVVPIFVQIYTIIATQVVPIIGSLAQWFVTKLVPAVAVIVGAIAKNLKPVLDSIFKVINDSVIPVVKQIIAKFKEWQPTIQKVIEVVVKVVGKVLEFASAILGKVLPPVIKFAGFLLQNLVPVVFKVVEIVAKVIGKVIEFGVSAFNAGKKIGEFVLSVIKVIAGLQQKVLGVLTGAASWLLNVGKDIINGLKTGISNGWQAVQDFIKSLIDKIPAVVRKALGIASDSKVFKEIGKHIGGGLASGMDATTKAVANASGNMALAVQQGFSTPALAMDVGLNGVGGGGGNTYQITINSLDPSTAGKVVVDAIKEYESVNGGGWRR